MSNERTTIEVFLVSIEMHDAKFETTNSISMLLRDDLAVSVRSRGVYVEEGGGLIACGRFKQYKYPRLRIPPVPLTYLSSPHKSVHKKLH